MSLAEMSARQVLNIVPPGRSQWSEIFQRSGHTRDQGGIRAPGLRNASKTASDIGKSSAGDRIGALLRSP